MKAQQEYSLKTVQALQGKAMEPGIGGRRAWFDSVTEKWRLRILLDKERIWFLSVFLLPDGTVDGFSLDRELAEDSHFEFKDAAALREKVYKPGDEDLPLDGVLSRVIAEQGGNALLSALRPLVTAEYHFD